MDGQRSRLMELESSIGGGTNESTAGLTAMVSPRETMHSATAKRRGILHQPPAASLKAGARTTRDGTNDGVGRQKYTLKIVMNLLNPIN